METMIQKMMQKKKEEKARIDYKVETEQILPTTSEKKSISDIIQTISDTFRNELTDPTIDKEALNARIRDAISKEISSLEVDYEQKRRLEKLALTNIIGLGPIQQYLDNPEISEIIVQRYDNICVEKNGKIYATRTVFTDEEHLKNVINRILQPTGRDINISAPIVDADLSDGSRICATIPPVSPKGATLTIRKFYNAMMQAEKYLELGSLSEPMLKFLKICVENRVSVFISGGTGTGKTTFLNMLSSFLPENELVITIEDTLELQLRQKNIRSMVVRKVTNGNQTMEEMDMASLVKAALRMRPDRIIVGETRDGAVVSLLTAMSTGHEGSMSTGHANSAYNLVNSRIPTMMEMDRSTSFSEKAQAMLIREGIELIVQLKRLPDGKRIVSEICEVTRLSGKGEVILTDIYKYDYGTRQFLYTGNMPKRIQEHVSFYGFDLTEEILKGSS